MFKSVSVSAVSFVSALAGIASALAQTPETIAVSGETLVAVVHAEGAQIYECVADASGKNIWQFREPIATLFANGKTVGRHYAGPSWELTDGSKVSAKVAGRAPGATPNDIPLLKLDASSQGVLGRLADVTTIQRLKTKGGALEGPCDAAGMFMSVPYAADYTFFKK